MADKKSSKTYPWPGLPFVADIQKSGARHGKRDFWHLPDAADYGEACDIGRRWAVSFLKEEREVQLLPWIVQAMTERELANADGKAPTPTVQHNGVAVGFLSTLEMFARSAARLGDPERWLQQTEDFYAEAKRKADEERREAATVRVARMNEARKAKRAALSAS